jgi:hypothetical protein
VVVEVNDINVSTHVIDLHTRGVKEKRVRAHTVTASAGAATCYRCHGAVSFNGANLVVIRVCHIHFTVLIKGETSGEIE